MAKMNSKRHSGIWLQLFSDSIVILHRASCLVLLLFFLVVLTFQCHLRFFFSPNKLPSYQSPPELPQQHKSTTCARAFWGGRHTHTQTPTHSSNYTEIFCNMPNVIRQHQSIRQKQRWPNLINRITSRNDQFGRASLRRRSWRYD